MALRIEDYAMIGDCETAALVGRDGSIDWLCWPRFDSAACFAALLGTSDNGRWLLAPKSQPLEVTRRYRPGTLILETEFRTETGTAVVIDFMPPADSVADLVRIVCGLSGQVTFRMRSDPPCESPAARAAGAKLPQRRLSRRLLPTNPTAGALQRIGFQAGWTVSRSYPFALAPTAMHEEGPRARRRSAQRQRASGARQGVHRKARPKRQRSREDRRLGRGMNSDLDQARSDLQSEVGSMSNGGPPNAACS
jgi:hypothetical protein